MRLSQLDPDAPLPASIPRELWSALFCYVAAGASTEATLEIELPLPSDILHDSLLVLGARLDSPGPNYHISRSALWQQFHFARKSAVPPPFPQIQLPKVELDGKTTVLAHPLRAPKPKPGSEIYSQIGRAHV